MVANIKSGNSFGHLLRYLTNENKKEWMDERNIGTVNPDLAKVLMDDVAGQSDQIEKPVYHVSLSWSKFDNPSKHQMIEVVDRWLDHMGLDEHQCVMVAHGDTDHPHLHLAINRVHPETEKAWDRWKDRETSEEILRELEDEFGWEKTYGKNYSEISKEFDEYRRELWEEHRAREKKEVAEALGINQSEVDDRPLKERALELKDQLFQAQSFKEFDQILDKNGLWLDRKGQGMVVTDGAYQMKASDINRHLSGPKLEEKFGRSLDDYITQREKEIDPLKALEYLGDWKKGLEQKELERVEKALQRKSQKAQARAQQFQRLDKKMEQVMSSIKKDFKKAYENPEKGYKEFGKQLSQAENKDELLRALAGDPESLGKIANEKVASRLQGDFMEASKVRGQLSGSIKAMSKAERKQHLAKLERQAKSTSKKLSGVRTRISDELKEELRETEAGRASEKMGYQALSVHRAIQRIMEDKEAAPKEVGKQLFQQLKGKADSQAGQSLGMISSEAMKYSKAIAHMINNPASGSLKLAKSVIKSATRLTQQSGRGYGR